MIELQLASACCFAVVTRSNPSAVYAQRDNHVGR